MRLERVLDIHTHTLMSGHAFCTLNEMISAAKNRGLTVYGVAEHGPRMDGTCSEVYFRNLNVVPRTYGGMRLVMGVELNILDSKGTIDLPEKILREIDWRIAGLHSCYKAGTVDQNTEAIVNAMRNPMIDMISHPVDGTADVDIEAIVIASKETGTLIELNNNSLLPRRKKPKAYNNFKEMLLLCKKHDVPVIVSSDAHIDVDIANFDCAEKLLTEVDFPDGMVINNNPEAFLQRLDERG